MTTDDLYLLVAETRCEHGLLSLDAALRSGDDWTAYLRAPPTPAPSPSATSPPTRPSPPTSPPPGSSRLPTPRPLAAPTPPLPSPFPTWPSSSPTPWPLTPPPWHLSAIRRPRTAAADGATTYLVDLVDPATAEVRAVPTLAAYHQTRCPAPAPAPAPLSSPPRPPR